MLTHTSLLTMGEAHHANPMVVARRSTMFATSQLASLCTSYPSLYYHGTGGPSAERPIRIGPEVYFTHLMRLSSRAFAQDRTFLLVAFDILARSRLQSSIHIRVRSRTNLLEQVMDLTPENVRTWVVHCEAREEAERKGLRLPPPPPSIGHVAAANNFIHTSMAAHWGSNEERALCRRQLLSKCGHQGLPHVFLTISPNSAQVYVIASLSSDTLLPAGTLEALNRGLLSAQMMPNRMTQDVAGVGMHPHTP
jgi:hypothetical protein